MTTLSARSLGKGREVSLGDVTAHGRGLTESRKPGNQVVSMANYPEFGVFLSVSFILHSNNKKDNYSLLFVEFLCYET